MTNSASSQRLHSLDIFRGMVIAFMVLVNTPGTGEAVYAPLQHAAWDGWTPTDVVFPSFVWITGVALTLALARRLEQGISRSELVVQTLKRSAILFALGLFVYLFPYFDFSTMRILGVLQRIAICYCCAALLFLYTGWRVQVAVTVGLLLLYWALMSFVPVPGYGAGRLDVEGNFAHYIDRIVLGKHNYVWTKTWDPEGIVSTLPAIASALLGVLAGHLLRWKKDAHERTLAFFVAGNVVLALGLAMAQWQPINKKLWSGSFTLFMAGLDGILFAVCLGLVDALAFRSYAQPFVMLGRNAIAIYMISEIIEPALNALRLASGRTWKQALFEQWFLPLGDAYFASFLYALMYTLLMLAIAWAMHQRRWYWRV
jgi:predicted acyltransferase